MPTYSYRCTACSNAFDIQQSFTDDSLTACPECGGALRKLFSAVGISFKGSGFYANDHGSRAKATASASAESSSSASSSGADSGSSSGSSASGSGDSGASASSAPASAPAPTSASAPAGASV